MAAPRRTPWPVFALIMLSQAMVAWVPLSRLLTTGQLEPVDWFLLIASLTLIALCTVGLVRAARSTH